MPIPSASFTKTKWLAFFAELTAKVTHHNVLIVIEGCEVIKRLLVSQVSVAAFLEEGSLLTYLVDTIAGNMLSNEPRNNGPPLAIAQKLLFTQLETLSLIIDMMVALHTDKDSYYCLLVLARAGVITSTLVTLLQRQHPCFFGVIATMVKVLLGLPLGREVRGLHQVDENRSVALASHIRQLQDAVIQHGAILKEAIELLQALSISTEGPMQYCSVFLLNLAKKRFTRIQKRFKHGIAGSGVCWMSNTGLNYSEHNLADTTADNTMGDQTFLSATTGGECSSFIDKEDMMVVSSVVEEENGDNTVENVDCCIPKEAYNDCFERLSRCRSHNEFLEAINFLWCLTVAAGDELERCFTSLHFEKAFKRFLLTMPQNQQDQMVFTSVLLWLSHMMSGYRLQSDTRDTILCVVGSSLIPIALKEIQSRKMLAMRGKNDFLGTDVSMTTGVAATITSGVTEPSVSMLGSDSFPSSCMAGDKCVDLVERPSISFLVLSFLLITDSACGPQQVEGWIRQSGLFAMVEALIRNVEHTKSVLIDTPTTMDGALSDEVYLSCALASTRTEHVTLAALSCKLLSSIIWNHYVVLKKLLAPEISVMLKRIIPLLMKIGIHNPTLTSATENVSGSALHHSPRCQRSSRYTSLGECSLVALDACFWLTEVAQLNVVQLKDVIPNLLALLRVTRNSIHPPIRASVYRCFTRLCRSSVELMTVLHEMPLAVNAAVSSVLEYSPAAPQWEAAAAAEWLTHVIHIASSNAKVEQQFNFSHTALPIKLVELASSNGITYATATFLSLTASLFEQEKRFAAHQQEIINGSVIVSCGRRSLDFWSRLIQTATQTGEKLAHAQNNVIPAASTTKDALSRSLSSIEGISIQFFFVCSLARGLLFLLHSCPEHMGHFSNDLMYGLFESTFSLPSPDAVFTMLAVRFGVKVDHHATLERSYENMLLWMVELCSMWFGTINRSDTNNIISSTGNSTSQSVPLPQPAIFDHLYRILQNDRLSHQTHAHICMLVSNVLVSLNSFPTAASANATAEAATANTLWKFLCEALASSSVRLFAASLCLKPASCVSGMQCRLVALFSNANEEAYSCGWFSEKVLELQEHVQTLKENAGTVGSNEMELLLVSLSCVCSVVSFEGCREVPVEVLHSLCLSLRDLLGYETTRRAAFQAADSLACSSEGRRCLLYEVSTSGDPLSRTCFGRILGIILGVRQGGEHPQLQRENNNATRRTPISEREASMVAVAAAGLDICAIVCSKGGEAFTHAVIKMRGIEHIESLFLKYDRKRSPIPLGIFRLIAAISFHQEAQLVIIRQTELMTILLEASVNANSAGTLALLTIRNLCFNSTIKTQLCQDERVLLTLKAALITPQTLQSLSNDTNNQDSNESMKLMRSPKGDAGAKKMSPQKFPEQSSARQQHHHLQQKTEVEVSQGGFENTNVLRRQDLAVTAFWSLMYDNQRGKSYVRGVLNNPPVVNMNKLIEACGHVPVKETEMEEYSKRMSNAIRNIKILGKGAF